MIWHIHPGSEIETPHTMKGLIRIIGPIGTFVAGNKVYNGVQLKQVIAQVSALPPETTEIQIDIASDGGNKPTGDAIYGFLMSLKPKVKIIMNQIGDVGSIASKIWFAGDERIALKGLNPETGKDYELFIHNPWMRVEGDAATMQAAIDRVKPEEDELRNFYMEQTGIPEAGIKPMMDQQTGINAELAVQMKFATSMREALNIAAYDMKFTKETETQLGAVLDQIKALFKKSATPPTASATSGSTPPAGAAGDELKGKAVVIDGKAPADGVYTIKGGVVDSFAALPAETPAQPEMPAALAAKIKEVDDLIATLKEEKPKADEIKPKTEAEILALVDAKVKEQVEAFKSTIKTLHTPKQHKDVIIDWKNTKETPVQARNREAMEKRAKQLV